MMPFRRLAAALCTLLIFCGCGNPGSPLPPSLLLPEPVADLSAARTGDAVSLHWTMTRRATDRVKLMGDQRAVICRAVETQACTTVGVLLVAAGQPTNYIDPLPTGLTQGSLRLLRYEVHLQNHARQSAGASNPAFTAAGWAPPPITSVDAAMTAAGIAVHWQAPPAHPAEAPVTKPRLLARLVRDRVQQAGALAPGAEKQNTLAGVPQAMQQTLEAPEHVAAFPGSPWEPGHTLDTQAELNHSYRYSVQLVEQVTLADHGVEISGRAAHSDVLSAKDVFPPAVPSDLAVVADNDGGTIDLSWTAGLEADLAGYAVYRKVAGASGPAQRISGAAVLTAPAWSDKSAQRGERYAYSVTAIDGSGNESAPSPEVTGMLTQ